MFFAGDTKKRKTKFKVGDKVKVRQGADDYALIPSGLVRQLKGKILTISGTSSVISGCKSYELAEDLDNVKWQWPEYALKKASKAKAKKQTFPIVLEDNLNRRIEVTDEGAIKVIDIFNNTKIILLTSLPLLEKAVELSRQIRSKS